jgi:glucose-1-phosphate cytidylyltransferase
LKAIILCGGQGTRIREHSETKPKPMIEVGDRPILWHIMKIYAHHDITDFVLCLGHQGHVVKEYFLHYEAMNNDFTVELGVGDGIEFHGVTHDEDGWGVTLADTGVPTQTGGRIHRASKYIPKSHDTFCATYGDGLADVDLKAMLAYHRQQGGLATMLGVGPPGRFGALRRDGNRVTEFCEKPEDSQGLINGGYFFFERGFLDYLSSDEDCILERGPLERCAADGNLFVYEHRGFWGCMDTYRDWLRLEEAWKQNRAPWKVWK